MASGKSVAFALNNLQARGRLFVGPNEEIYEGMIVGLHSRGNDLPVNPLKEKQLTNIRAAGSDENVMLTPPVRHSLEAATGYSDRLLHGEGVAIGTCMAFRFSERLGICPAGRAQRVAEHFTTNGMPTHVRDIPGPALDADSLLETMYQDKKASGGKLVFILARDIGDTYVARDILADDVLAFLKDELAAA